ncbi:hypothetical protein NDA13_006073 [Ustilago tritici]|nr:hypothetical protein NDA13_006073 [Ustilago tritici]
MVSAPPGRSATVTSLSGRVNALKFMQRASPSSTPTKASNSTASNTAASTSHTPLASPSLAASASGSPAPFGATEGAVEEQWSLSPAAIARLRAKATGSKEKKKETTGPEISQQAGFDAWLITRDQPTSVAGKGDSRQTFGKLGKNKEEDPDDTEPGSSKKRSRTDEGEGLEPDFDSASNSSEADELKGFVKPGTLQGARKQQRQSSPSSAKQARSGGKKDQDKVVFARKRGGKAGISVLWRKQPFPDNHVPASFLSDLRTNSQIILPSLGELMIASLRLSARFLSVVLFALLFVHLHLGTLDSEMLLLVILSVSLLSALLSSLLEKGKNEDREGRKGRGGRSKTVSTALTKLIMGLVLLAVSPVLRTLTESTTSDSIWALSTVLFFLHLALADYTSPSPQQGGKKLSDTLSFNAAISASVVLASRLNSNTETFTLLTLAIVLFAPTNSSSAPKGSWGGVGRFSLLYLVTMATTASLLFLKVGEKRWVGVVVAWTNLVVGFVSVVCPYWIKYAQGWKMEISGPWDPAEPILSSSRTP